MKRNSKYLIYALCCPVTGAVYYVGKSTQGMLRPMTHMDKSHSAKIRAWVEQLSLIGHKPHIKICEFLDGPENINNRERYWIQKYLDDGEELLNEQLIKRRDPIERNVKSVGRFIATKRKNLGLNQYEFAKKSGVGVRFIRELEKGTKQSFNMAKVNLVLRMFGHELVPQKSDMV